MGWPLPLVASASWCRSTLSSSSYLAVVVIGQCYFLQILPASQNLLLLECHVRLFHRIDLLSNKLHLADLRRD